jgi:hypothetical protein
MYPSFFWPVVDSGLLRFRSQVVCYVALTGNTELPLNLAPRLKTFWRSALSANGRSRQHQIYPTPQQLLSLRMVGLSATALPN